MKPPTNRSTDDAFWMRRAIRLSQGGFPAPNPPVGCVIVKDGQWIADGGPTFAGGNHAEIEVLTAAKDRARGATAYVTLEPCNHHGRTGPCSEALIAAGIARAVVAVRDPNPRAAGGVDRLREAGIDVSVGIESVAAERSLAPFLFSMRHQRPYVVVKAAFSLDGRIALPSGESQWITGPAARLAGHWLRARLGAVLVGWRTVAADDPHLTARLPGVVNPPLRIVLDPNQQLTGKERVFDGAAPTRHVTGPINLPELMRSLHQDGVTGLLVEGGARTVSEFFAAGLVNRAEAFVAPKLLGAGPTWYSNPEIERLADHVRLGPMEVRRRGNDLQIGADVIGRETTGEGEDPR